MVIESLRFTNELNFICDFIANDSFNRAKIFQKDLKAKLEQLPSNPKVYRKSTKFDDESIRDFIYKGYVIPYLIDEQNIVILGIYKDNEWE